MRVAGYKFDEQGAVKPFWGMSVISPVAQRNNFFFNDLLNFYRDANKLAYGHKYAFLPSSSYHMTIFDICHEHSRKDGSCWPSYVSKDSTVDDCLNKVLLKFETYGVDMLDIKFPIRMKVSLAKKQSDPSTIKLQLEPLDEDEDEELQKLRNLLAELSGVRNANHDSYKFHITLAYQLETLTEEEQRQFDLDLEAFANKIASRHKVIKFDDVLLTSFNDMYFFWEQSGLT